MIKHSYSMHAVAKLATAVLLIGLLFTNLSAKNAVKKTMTTPDFAYPKTVEKNAEIALEKAVAHGDWQAAVESAIQSVTAGNMVSNRNAKNGLIKIDSIANIAPDAWKPAFLLIEAEMYNSIYNSIRWKADNRKLSLDSVPENPIDWSRDIFAEKIYNICKDIMDNTLNEGKSLKEWSAFLENTSDAYAFGMTVDEFLSQQCFTVLNVYSDATRDVIPFFSSASKAITPVQKCSSLRDRAIEMLIDKTSQRKQSMLLAKALADRSNTLPFSMRMKYLTSALDQVKATEGEQLILSELRIFCNEDPQSGMESAFPYSLKDYIAMLRKSLADFPNGMYANSLKNIINDLTQPYSEITYKRQYLTSDQIKMDVRLTNCNESWVLVYDYSTFAETTKSPKNKEIAAKCRLVKAVKVSAKGSVPFSDNTEAQIGTLAKGIYAVIPSATSDGNGIYASIQNDSWREPFSVSDISAMSLQQPDASTRVFVVDGANGKPIEGAQVKVFTRKNYSAPRQLSKTLTTGKDGSVIVTEEKFDIEALYNGSKWSSDVRYYNSRLRQDSATRNHIQILTDRALFHPGDSIKAAIILYSSKRSELNLLDGFNTEIRLVDANGKQVATQNVVSDKFGRATVDFSIPDDGLLGNWNLTALDDKGSWLGIASFQVADYVAPTFFITSENTEEDVAPGDIVRLKGQVLTYSGMPVANAVVKYNVTYTPPMRWYMSSGATYDSSVTADPEGKYVIELPTSNLKGTQFERGVFSVRLSATSPAGETQNGPTERFAIGKEFNISPVGGGIKTLDVSEGISDINFNVTDMLGRKVKKEVKYSLKNATTKAVVAEGTFTSPILTLPEKGYPSAVYTLDVTLAEDNDVKSSLALTIWRKSDKAAPEGTKLWVPVDKVIAGKDDSKVNVMVGSGVSDRWIPAVLSADGEILSVDWLHIEKDNLSVPVMAPKGKLKYMLNLSYISDLETESANVSILPASSEEYLQVATESFRDKISSGDQEHWSFRFFRKSGNASRIPALAVMTDAALNAITPFQWYFNTSGMRNGSYYSMRESLNYQRHMHQALKAMKYLSYGHLTLPEINDYGQGWGLAGIMDFGSDRFYAVQESAAVTSVRGTSNMMAKMAAPMTVREPDIKYEVDGVAMDDAVVEEESMEAPAAGAFAADVLSENGNQAAKEIELRETECPIAFFKPYLISDNDGIVNLDFTVPNYNTTWALQVLGYDESVQTAKIALEAVASKPIMVSTHAPRFVRIGDVISLNATVFNNSDAVCSPKCRIELVDLLSGKAIAGKEFAPEAIEVASNRLICMDWTVPSDVSSVGFRAYAETDGHSDGEQALLPVIPASSPVVESTPFWFSPDSKRMEVKLPKFKETDQVTLQYCDNPAWYCLTALPEIVVPDSKSITAKVKALFGNVMAYNLISSRPGLKTGLENLLSDSDSPFAAIKSNLEKDGNLKIAQLSNTPWVNNAESETLRMSRLSSLLNDEEAKKAIGEILGDIRSLQDRDGGWSWCPDMESSPYITRVVLRHFSMMLKAGALSHLDNSEKMIKSAIKYVDAETVKDYKKYHKKGESLSYLLDWLYVRSGFPASYISSGLTGSEMSSLADKARKDIASEWKDMGIGSKAKAAAVLWRAGNHKTANEILESLRQYASESPEKGMWFDNLTSGWGSMSVLQTTTLVLEAFAEIQPSNSIVDSLRQWLVLGRQYQDWGKNSFVVETVNAILTSGSDWTSPSSSTTPEFKLKDTRLNIPETAKLTGAFTLTLDAKEASKKTLSISRGGNGPAWGGVIAQYEAPILEVKPSDVPELSIRKSLVALEEGENGQLIPKEGITLKKGMKVRVTLFITVDRDMDYVAVTDERSACLEPVDQLSGNTSSDRVRFYREVRDTATNLFFGWLPKGNHVISYDCTVSQDGDFSCGIATIQSLYSPTTVAHSAGALIKVAE